MSRTPFVSIVVTVRNGAKTIDRCVASLLDLDYPRDRFEILIVDGGSCDDTLEILGRWSSLGLSIIERPGNISEGRNEGIRRARGEFIAITDADMVVTPGWLRELVAAVKKGVAGVGGPNESATDDLVSRAVACIPVHGPSLGEIPPFGRPRFRKAFETTEWVYAAVTRNCLYRRDVLVQAGGFDEAFGGTEDVELNARLLETGHRLAYTPAAVVLHHHPDTFLGFVRRQWIYSIWQTPANGRHPRLFHPKHWLPTLALAGLVVSLALAGFVPELWPLPVSLVTVSLGTAFAYGIRAAIRKRDPPLALALPPLFLGWMLAWALGYPWGVRLRPRVREARCASFT